MLSPNVQYYGNSFEPSYFDQFGLRGRWVKLLNWIRFSLDCKVQYHVMRCLGPDADMQLRVAFDTERAKLSAFREYRPAFDTGIEGSYLPARDLTPEEASHERLRRLIPQGRSNRYAQGRRIFIVQEGFEDVEDDHGTGAGEDRTVQPEAERS